MPLPATLQIERMMNLIRNFGWEKVKEQVVADGVEVTVKLKIEQPPKPTPT